MTVIASLLWLLYFLAPSEGRIMNGLPLDRIETVGVLVVVWIAAHGVRVRGAWLVAALATGTIVASLAVPGEPGLSARYYSSRSIGGTHERGLGGDPTVTRIDDRLAFERDRHDLPLVFFNDHTRFNLMSPGDPDRRRLPFAVAWSGWWYVRAGVHTLYVNAPGASAEIAVDGDTLVDGSSSTRELTLAEGWHRLRVALRSPYGAPRSFSAGEITAGNLIPFGAGTPIRTERLDARQSAIASSIRVLKTVCDLVVLAWLGAVAALLLARRLGEFWQAPNRARSAMWLFMFAAALEGVRFAWPWADRLRIMAAGDDTMVYETYARDIVLNGLLMNGGAPLGQGEPFYYQALYPYFLAATHLLFGESMFGALLLQRVLVAITALLLVRIVMLLYGERGWPVALLLSSLFLWWKMAPISADFLNESLYVPLLTAWTTLLLELHVRPTWRRVIASGVVGGVTALTRSTALLAWTVAWPMTLRRLRHTPHRLRYVAAAVGCSLAVFSLIAIRNGLVSARFAPAPTEFGITLLGGNQPPSDMSNDVVRHRAVYERLHIDGYTAQVVEYAIQSPGLFLANIARKAAFALGAYEPYAPGWGYSPVYLLTTIAAFGGVLFLLRKQPQLSWPTVLLPLSVALTQYLAVVVVYPKGERLILPIHVLLLPYAAIAAAAVMGGAAFPVRAAVDVEK